MLKNEITNLKMRDLASAREFTVNSQQEENHQRALRLEIDDIWSNLKGNSTRVSKLRNEFIDRTATLEDAQVK